MRSLRDIALVLESQFVRGVLGKLQLAKEAGITYRTLQHVFSGTQDYKVTTLMAVADRLGLELVLVPKEAARGLVQDHLAQEVQTRVQAALDRFEGGRE
jgi:transcriptional regulator with XRE-family HTH domain